MKKSTLSILCVGFGLMIIVPVIMFWSPALSADSEPVYVYVKESNILLTYSDGEIISADYTATFFNEYNTDILEATTVIKLIQADDKTVVASFEIKLENVYAKSKKDIRLVLDANVVDKILILSQGKNLGVEYDQISCVFGVAEHSNVGDVKNRHDIA
jgi:membrane protein CcdC involved in cytochrome C biogenesis